MFDISLEWFYGSSHFVTAHVKSYCSRLEICFLVLSICMSEDLFLNLFELRYASVDMLKYTNMFKYLK